MLLACVGTFIGNQPLTLTLGWLLAVVPLCVLTRVLRAHIKFIAVVLAPIACMQILVWGILIGAPPGEPLGVNPKGGIDFALVMSLRLALLGGTLQLSLLTIPPDRIAMTLWRWGIRNDRLIVVLSAYVLGPEMRLRANQVRESRLASGLIPDRSLITAAHHLPGVLIPLFAWALRSAVHRADEWQRRQLLRPLAQLARAPEDASWLASVGVVLLAAVWVGLNTWLRLET